MAKHVPVVSLAAGCVALLCLLGPGLPTSSGQDKDKTKKPRWTHALDLKCREGGMEDFDKAKVFGVEGFKDQNTNYLIYISQTGALSVASAASTPDGENIKKPEWNHALELKCRKYGEEDFDKAKLFGVEAFKDVNTDLLVYICQTGDIAAVSARASTGGETAKQPKWTHALDLKVRPGREESFDNARTYGVEAFRDDNAGQLIYISQTGSVAAVAAKLTTDGDKVKKPKWSHALDLKCRKGGVEDFDKADVFGVEVFLDENAGTLIYISQTGSIAVVPAKGGVVGEKAKKPRWTHALDLRCRPGKEKDFDKAKLYGVEVFRDENTDNLIYISDTGSIAVVPAKGK
jgi:hypothetical protein